MKSKLQITGVLSSVILLICLCFFLIRAGYAGDEYGLSNSSFEGFNALDSYGYADIAPNILEISWEEAETLIKENHLNFLYIGRDNCPYCLEFEPRLNELAIDADITIYHYNTISDREEIPEEFQERMEYLGVDSVPSMFIVGNGDFEKLDSDDIDSLLEQVKANLSQVD